VEKVGEGGMGVVWKAQDTRLGRTVAVKLLPEAFAENEQRISRFKREARLLATLSHSYIASIHEFEAEGRTHFIVMEFVEGSTLAELTARGPLPLEETLATCRQIAQALEAAHQKGVVHRDLKPANVKVTSDGQVKVLDFGLAKDFVAATDDPDQSPTAGLDATESGVIIGTPAYMSPEQARGKPMDKRTDVWSFGCLLYQCLTGKQPFAGETASDIISEILTREPDWDLLPADTPTAIRRLLGRCLQKDANRRLHDIADARIEIEECLEGEPEAQLWTERDSGSPTKKTRRLTWILAGVAVALALILGIYLGGQLRIGSDDRGSVSRYLIEHPPAHVDIAADSPSLALSPDGTNLVYVSEQDSVRKLYLRPSGRFKSTPIPGTENAHAPFFSPDGEWIGFFADRQLKKVSVRGGLPIPVADMNVPRGAAWTPGGFIIFPPSTTSGLARISDIGGELEVVTTPDGQAGERSHRWPCVLPNGRAVLFTVGTSEISSFDEAGIEVLSLETGERRRLIDGGCYPAYIPTGHLLYARAGAIMAVPFDPGSLELIGSPTLIVDSVMTHPTTGCAQFAVSGQGTAAYLPGGVTRVRNSLLRVDREGRESTLLEGFGFSRIDVSPDGRFVALDIDGANANIWVYDIARKMNTRLTFEWSNNHPVWTPDSRWVTFTSSRGTSFHIMRKRADGSGEPEELAQSLYDIAPHSWSTDGQLLAFLKKVPETGSDIHLLAMDEERQQRPLLNMPFNELSARLSPDGRWLAYSSDETGRYEVYVQPFPGPGARVQISSDGGVQPCWSPDGSKLFYCGERGLFVAQIETESELRASAPVLFYEWVPQRESATTFDVTPTGDEFILIQVDDRPALIPIRVVLSFTRELEERLGQGLEL
jgi:serine/threonine protein kinase